MGIVSSVGQVCGADSRNVSVQSFTGSSVVISLLHPSTDIDSEYFFVLRLEILGLGHAPSIPSLFLACYRVTRKVQQYRYNISMVD